jgi:hypothetical protein
MEHPEQGPIESGFTQNPWDHLRYAEFVRPLEQASREQLLELVKKLAYDFHVVQPAAKRFLIGQAMPRPLTNVTDLLRELRRS